PLSFHVTKLRPSGDITPVSLNFASSLPSRAFQICVDDFNPDSSQIPSFWPTPSSALLNRRCSSIAVKASSLPSPDSLASCITKSGLERAALSQRKLAAFWTGSVFHVSTRPFDQSNRAIVVPSRVNLSMEVPKRATCTGG